MSVSGKRAVIVSAPLAEFRSATMPSTRAARGLGQYTVDGGVHALSRAPVEEHLDAFPRQIDGDGEPDTRGRGRHERSLASELQVHGQEMPAAPGVARATS